MGGKLRKPKVRGFLSSHRRASPQLAASRGNISFTKEYEPYPVSPLAVQGSVLESSQALQGQNPLPDHPWEQSRMVSEAASADDTELSYCTSQILMCLVPNHETTQSFHKCFLLQSTFTDTHLKVDFYAFYCFSAIITTIIIYSQLFIVYLAILRTVLDTFKEYAHSFYSPRSSCLRGIALMLVDAKRMLQIFSEHRVK